MTKEYWKQYYEQNKKKIKEKCRKWQHNNPERAKELVKASKEKRLEYYKQVSRQCYKAWISIEQNRRRKKEYQKMWRKSKFELMQEENLEFEQLEQALNRGQNLIRGYIVELKQDREGKWFYYLLKFGALYFISDKFETRKQAIKDMQYAI